MDIPSTRGAASCWAWVTAVGELIGWGSCFRGWIKESCFPLWLAANLANAYFPARPSHHALSKPGLGRIIDRTASSRRRMSSRQRRRASIVRLAGVVRGRDDSRRSGG